MCGVYTLVGAAYLLISSPFFPLRNENEGFSCPGMRGLPDFRLVLTWDLQNGHRLAPSSCLSFEGTMEAGREESSGFSFG